MKILKLGDYYRGRVRRAIFVYESVNKISLQFLLMIFFAVFTLIKLMLYLKDDILIFAANYFAY